MPGRFFVVVLMILAIGVTVFLAARRRLAERPALRARLLVGGVVLLAAAAGAALAMPKRLPETPGSPASLVWSLFWWFLGAILALGGLPILLAALLPGPRRAR